MSTASAEASGSSAQLQSSVRTLKDEVHRLQKELGDLHSADYNTLKRAYVSLLQHFRALQVEAQVMKAHIDALDVEVMNPDDVAGELTAVAAVAALAVAAGRLFRSPRLSQLRVGLWAGGALFLGWRFTTAGLGRLGSLLVRNRQRKRRLQRDWEALMERIRIMDALTHWEGQDPSLAQQRIDSPGPAASEGDGSSWVDVTNAAEESEGKVSYPRAHSPVKAYTAAAARSQDLEEEGIVSYPQVRKAQQAASEPEEGEVSYPSIGQSAGSLRSRDLPTAPPLPKSDATAELDALPAA